MNKEFIEKSMWHGKYSLKPDTSTSYIFAGLMDVACINKTKERAIALCLKLAEIYQSNDIYLPFRLSLIDKDSAKITGIGRNVTNRCKQLKAYFGKCEMSPLKRFAPFEVHTSIWPMHGSKYIYYGTIGINPAPNAKVKDNGDLLVIYTKDWEDLDVYVFKGLAKPNDIANLAEVVEYVKSLIR